MFTAETHAGHLALNSLKKNNRWKFAIFIDSLGRPKAFQKRVLTNIKVCKLNHTIADLQKPDRTIELCWIFCHADMSGNKNEDKNVKEAPRR